MNYSELIVEIKSELVDSGYESLATDLTEAQLRSSVPGEMLIMVCSKLIEVSHLSQEAFCRIEKDARIMIDYARSIGLEPRWEGKSLRSL